MRHGHDHPQVKGMDKWAKDGFHNLRKHANDEDRALLDKHEDRMMLHEKMKNLLVTASNYQPGSKPLDQIVGHLKKHIAKDTK